MQVDYEIMLAALCIWREARGEGRDGMRAVAHVIRNRKTPEHGVFDVVTKKWQFSSMTAIGDPQTIVFPNPSDPIFQEAVQIAQDVLQASDPDLTNGADHYFNPHVVLPEWASRMTKVASIGNHDFYKS